MSVDNFLDSFVNEMEQSDVSALICSARIGHLLKHNQEELSGSEDSNDEIGRAHV